MRMLGNMAAAILAGIGAVEARTVYTYDRRDMPEEKPRTRNRSETRRWAGKWSPAELRAMVDKRPAGKRRSLAAALTRAGGA